MSKQYPQGTPSKHATVRVPKDLLDAMNNFLKTDTAKKMGFLHTTNVVTEAVREFLKERGYYPSEPILEHFNPNEHGVQILDRSLDPPKGRLFQVYIGPDRIFCEYDQTNDCRHTEFALEQPEVQRILKEKGWKPK